MGGRICAHGHAADDGDALPGQHLSKFLGGPAAFPGAAPGANDGEGLFGIQVGLSLHIQGGRGVHRPSQPQGIGRAGTGQRPNAGLLQTGEELEKEALIPGLAQGRKHLRPQKFQPLVPHVFPYVPGILKKAQDLIKPPRTDALYGGKPDPVLLHDGIFHANAPSAANQRQYF